MGIYRRPVYVSPRMVVEFEMDRAGMRKIARGKELRVAVLAIAHKGRAYAEGISPVRTGDYRRSWRVNAGHVVVRGMRRVMASLVNTDPAAVPIEVGAAAHDGWPATEGHHVLQKTLVFLGGDARQPLTTPTVRTQQTMQPVPGIDEFRARQRERRQRERRSRGRRRNSG